MKLIIAGSRDLPESDRSELVAYALCVAQLGDITEIVSGAARGADRLGEMFGECNEIPIKRFPANWREHGRSAGPRRNREMAKYADALLAFWDGKSFGTKDMIRTMKKLGKPVYVAYVPRDRWTGTDWMYSDDPQIQEFFRPGDEVPGIG